MPSSAKKKTTPQIAPHELTQLSILLALAIALRLLETLLPSLLPLPGIRLGLSNIMTIIVLCRYGSNKAGVFLLARILLVGLLASGLGTPGFLIGLGGAALSFVFMSWAVERHWFSPIGLGLLGAAMHNCGQIIMAMHLMQTTVLLSYLPLLLLIGIPTGLLTGALANRLLQTIK